MALEIEPPRKDNTKFLTMTLITIGLTLLLVVPLLGIVIFNGDDGPVKDAGYIDQTGAATGDAPMDRASREAWEEYLKTAPSLEVKPHSFDSELEDRELDLVDSLPGSISDNTDYQEPAPSGGNEGAYDASDDDRSDKETDDGSDGSNEREVEEADIVKAIDDRIFVLNNYMGFLSVNMEDPARPYVEGRTPVLGTPVSMYIVDFLGFVIVSNAPSMEGTVDGSSGRIYILDLTDKHKKS
ncbi:MAG: hypothetical protein ACMUHY_07780 [Thermoplasmatota archaeon]